MLRQIHGVDVSDVPINRGPEVAAEARSLGARAFARDAEVFLPDHEGPLDAARTRGLLAHELTHAAQQRVLGSNLPAEESEAGRALEAQANASERWALGLGAPPSGSALSSAAVTSWTAPWASRAHSGVQRQVGDAEDVPMSAIDAPAMLTATPPQPTTVTAPSSQAPAVLAAIDGIGVTPPYVSQQLDSVGFAESVTADPELRAARDKLVALARKRPLDLDDPQEVRLLADEVYKRVHSRLRHELLVDRERSGRLSDFR